MTAAWQAPPWYVQNAFGIVAACAFGLIAVVFAWAFWYESTLEPVDWDECAAARGAMLEAFAARYHAAGGPAISDAAMFNLWQQQEWKRHSDNFDTYLVPPSPPECRQQPPPPR